jgi:hypothetical protein
MSFIRTIPAAQIWPFLTAFTAIKAVSTLALPHAKRPAPRGEPCLRSFLRSLANMPSLIVGIAFNQIKNIKSTPSPTLSGTHSSAAREVKMGAQR